MRGSTREGGGAHISERMNRDFSDSFKEGNVIIFKTQIDWMEIYANSRTGSVYDDYVLDSVAEDVKLLIERAKEANNTVLIVVVGPNPIHVDVAPHCDHRGFWDPTMEKYIAEKVDPRLADVCAKYAECEFVSVLKAAPGILRQEFFAGAHMGHIPTFIVGRAVYSAILDMLVVRSTYNLSEIRPFLLNNQDIYTQSQ